MSSQTFLKFYYRLHMPFSHAITEGQLYNSMGMFSAPCWRIICQVMMFSKSSMKTVMFDNRVSAHFKMVLSLNLRPKLIKSVDYIFACKTVFVLLDFLFLFFSCTDILASLNQDTFTSDANWTSDVLVWRNWKQLCELMLKTRRNIYQWGMKTFIPFELSWFI